MSSPENDNPAAGETTDWKAECAELRRRSSLQFIALVVMSLTLTGFFGVQFWRTSRDLKAMLPQATQVVEMNKAETPRLENLVNKLASYSKTHPEFATNLLMKYGIRLEYKGLPEPSSAAVPSGLEAPPISTPAK